MLNVAVVMGRLAADPELRHTSSGLAVTSFTLAVDRGYAKQGQERQTDWIDVVAWRQTAEFICKYFTKGQMMAVQGSLQTRNWEDKTGAKRKSTELVADQVSFTSSKRESGGDFDRGNFSGRGNFDQGYQRAPAEQPAAFSEPAPAYSSGSAQDFQDFEDYEEVTGDDDLPF